MIVILERFCYADSGTFGKLILPSGQELATVERPWLDNKKGISCIPVGTYSCRPRPYYRGGYKAVEILDVKDRSYILFHKGNWSRNVKGCIAVCESHGCLSGEWAGLNSSLGFSAFMREVGSYEFKLTIKNKNNQGYVIPA